MDDADTRQRAVRELLATKARNHEREWLGVCVLVFSSALLAGGCTSRTESTRAQDGQTLLPVSLPDLSKMVEPVRKQINDAHTLVTARAGNRQAAPADVADAYGQLGKLLMAADHPEVSELCFLNAVTLAPADMRWPYYLGHVYRKRGDLPKALTFFERALQLQPDDVASLVWLGDAYLAQGQPGQAEPRFAKALSLQPNSLSARFGLGRIALARQDHRRAATYLEEVLKLDPTAAGAHYPLGLAYRGLGEMDKAEAELRLRTDREILPADPLMVDLDELLESPQAYESRGIRALDQQKWTEAAALFRKGLELAPDSPALRHRLGTTLYMMGDAATARREFETVVRESPEYFLAQYSLGVLLQTENRHAEAIQRFSAALNARSSYTEARLRLAASLRRMGRARESLDHYEQILAVTPRLSEARLGHAMTLVRLGRDAEARDRLTEAAEAYPDESAFAHGLARLLAAAPDARVRDAQRALKLVETILAKEQRTPDLGETMAMALADLGRFEEAAALQRNLIAGAEKAGVPDAALRLKSNLELYERREPCRTPWSDEEMP